MESMEKSPESAKALESKSTEEGNASEEKATVSAAEKSDDPLLPSDDKDEESNTAKDASSHEEEKLPSPKVPEESRQNSEKLEESSSTVEPKAAVESEESKENDRVVVSEPEGDTVKSTDALAEKSPAAAEESPVPAVKSPVQAERSPLPSEKSPLQSEKSPFPSEKSPLPSEKSPLPSEKSPTPADKLPVLASEEKENESSEVGLLGNKNNEEIEGIKLESDSKITESENVERVSTKETAEVSGDECGVTSRPSSSLSNKDLLSKAEKSDEGESQKEDGGGPQDILASDSKSPDAEQSVVRQNEDTREKIDQIISEACADELMDLDESLADKDRKEQETNVDAMARADVDNDQADEAMEIPTQDESDPLSSAAEKDVEMSEEKNEGCEVEIHTDIVKSEAYREDDNSGDSSKGNDSCGKDKDLSKESDSTAPEKTSEEVVDKTRKESTDQTNFELTDKTSGEETDKLGIDSEKTPASEATAKEGDDDICIIPDTVPQMMRKKLKEITEKSTPETSSSGDQGTEVTMTKTVGESDQVVTLKDSSKEKRKSKDAPVEVDLESPRPQRQAAKKADSLIKVLAAVENYEPPESKPVLTILDKVNETNPCQQCGLVTYCKYKLTSKESYLYFCRELCYKEYTTPVETSVPVVTATLTPVTVSAPVPTPAELERPFERKCSQCTAKIVANDDRVLTWETMDFCSDDCLGKYQTALGSHCANCKGGVQNASLGKYCVRFGYDIKQFCCASCLEEFKKGLKVCSYCQKDISSDQGGFLAPVGDKGQFKDFCTPTCMEKYEQMSSSVAPPVPCHECAVCMEQKPVCVEVLSGNLVHKLCSQPCFAAFKFVNTIVADQCDMCKKYFDKAKSENYTIFYDEAPHSFCCKTCMNVYILAKRKIVPCSWCKVKKYNFDMIKKTTNTGQVVMMCSLHCLNLYQVSVSAVPSRRVKCDACGTMVSAQYHLTMSDGTMRNFCSYNCVGVFQSQFSRTAISAAGKDDVPVPTGGPKRAISRRTASGTEAESVGKGVPLPVISSVTSLAPNGEPLPAVVQTTVPVTGTIKVRGPQQRKGPNRDLPDLGKQSSADSGKSVSKQHVIVRPPHQPQRNNSGVQVRVIGHHKGVSCKPQLCAKETQTDDELTGKKHPIIVPIPVPIYIPAPMCMYSAPTPVPVPFPLPIPVPIFIPTTRNSTKGIIKEIKRIQEKIPADPFEAELLMMAEMVAAEKKTAESESEDGEAPAEPASADAGNGVSQTFSPEAVDSSNTFGDDIMQMALKLASTLDEQPVDFEAAVAPSTITPGRPHSSTATEDDNSDSDPDEPDPTEGKKVTRKRPARAISRSPASAPSKRSRRVSSSESLPVLPPADGSSTSTRTDVEKPDSHTVLKFTYGVNAWRQWVLQKNAQLEKAATSNRKLKLFKTDLLQLTADELNYSLCLFVKEVRKPNGTEYAPDTIYYLCLGIQLYLIENGRVDNIFSDPFFEKFTECLDEISKKFSTLYDDTQFIVTRVEEEHLWEAKQLGAHSPHVLLSTLMFFNTKHFNITNVDEHMMLSFSHIMKHWKRNTNAPGAGKAPGRNVLLRFYPSQAALDSNLKKKKVYEQSENEDDPLRCPVKLYEFYLSKCPESVKTRNDVFYLQPERSCVPDSPVWYSTMSLNKDTLLKMLRRVKMVKEINMAILK